MVGRDTFTARNVEAGCFTCRGATVLWQGANAQGVAARHHDTTQHPTWVRIDMMIQYGDRSRADDRQIDIEDAIAATGGVA